MVKIKTKLKKVYYSKNGSKISYTRARKEHQCRNCGNRINKGERQKTTSFRKSVSYYTIYTCSECW